MLATAVHRTILWGLLSATWAAGPAAGAYAAGGVITPNPDSVTSKPVDTADDPASAVDPAIQRGSRGVARNLLFAGVATAAVVAILSGIFALGRKHHPQAK